MEDKGETNDRRSGDVPSFQYWLSVTTNVAKRIGEVLLAHAPVILAFSGVALYLVGVVRTVGVLAAEDIPVTRGLPLTPLQDYLLRGLAVVVTPETLLLIVVLIAGTIPVALGIFGSQEEQATSAAEPNRFQIVRQGLSGLTPIIAVFVCLALLIVPVAEWLPLIPGAVGAGAALAGLSIIVDDRPTDFGVQAGFYVAVLLVSLSLAWGLNAYFHPPPLDLAKVQTVDGKTRDVKLLYASGDALYVAGDDDKLTGNRHVEIIPLGKVSFAEVSDGKPREYATVLELLGIKLWRYDKGLDGKYHFEKSSRVNSTPWSDWEPPWDWSLPW